MGRLSSSNNLQLQTDSDLFWSIKEIPQQKTKLPSPGKTTKLPRTLSGPKISLELSFELIVFDLEISYDASSATWRKPFALVATYMLYKRFFPNSERYKLWATTKCISEIVYNYTLGPHQYSISGPALEFFLVYGTNYDQAWREMKILSEVCQGNRCVLWTQVL